MCNVVFSEYSTRFLKAFEYFLNTLQCIKNILHNPKNSQNSYKKSLDFRAKANWSRWKTLKLFPSSTISFIKDYKDIKIQTWKIPDKKLLIFSSKKNYKFIRKKLFISEKPEKKLNKLFTIQANSMGKKVPFFSMGNLFFKDSLFAT
jgi:hypothetical protein